MEEVEARSKKGLRVKNCTGCNRKLSKTHFAPHKRHCRTCNAINKALSAEPTTSSAEYVHEQRLRNPARYMWTNKRINAKRDNVEFTIRVEDIKIPSHCPILGIPLRFERGRRGPSAATPSIDRINPARGYVPGNIRVISWRANELKRNGTLAEFKAIIRDMENGAL